MAQNWPPLYVKPGKFDLGRGPRFSIASASGGSGASVFIPPEAVPPGAGQAIGLLLALTTAA